MKVYLTDYPQYVPYGIYERAINQMVERLIKYPGLLSIYQIGSISIPGISDIDMVAVFQDDAACDRNPLKELSRSERYLFVHGLYGVSTKHFHKAQCYTFFHNYNLLWGERLSFWGKNLSKKKIRTLKIQIALEYLLKVYINITVERTYGIVKVRNLLLHTKALLYDLEFLGISSGRLYDLVEGMVTSRNNWFKSKPEKESVEVILEKCVITPQM